jgi:hypothetical protein
MIGKCMNGFEVGPAKVSGLREITRGMYGLGESHGLEWRSDYS